MESPTVISYTAEYGKVGDPMILKNSKHEAFAQYLAEGRTATEAATLAGYSEKSARNQGSRLQTNGDIVARIGEVKIRRSEQATVASGISQAWVISRLKENADRAMQAVPVLEDGKPSGEYTWNPNAANRALELIGKELGMF